MHLAEPAITGSKLWVGFFSGGGVRMCSCSCSVECVFDRKRIHYDKIKLVNRTHCSSVSMNIYNMRD